MKKLLLFLLLTLPAWAQTQPQIQGAGAPTNPCLNGGQQYVDTTNKVIYNCSVPGQNWVNIGLGNQSGGGGGGVSSFSGDGTVITNSGSTGAVTATIGSVPPTFWSTPQSYFVFREDFNTSNVSGTFGASGGTGQANFDGPWDVFSTSGIPGTYVSPADPGTIGGIKLTTGTTSGNLSTMWDGSGGTTQATWGTFNSAIFDLKMRVALANTATVQYRFGLFNNTTAGNSDRITIEYDTTASDTGWMAAASSAGTATRTAITGSTLDTNYHDLRIRCTTPGTILYSVDGGTEVSISTHVPTTNLSRWLAVTTEAASAAAFKADYYFFWEAITR